MKNTVIFFVAIFLFSIPVYALEEKKSEVEVEATSAIGFEGKAKMFFEKTKTVLENFRAVQAEHFATLRDTTKIKLGIQVADDVFKKLSDSLSQPPAPNPIPGTEASDGLYIKKIDNPGLYALLVLYTSLASLFASPLMFYGIGALLAFFVIRFLIRSFV